MRTPLALLGAAALQAALAGCAAPAPRAETVALQPAPAPTTAGDAGVTPVLMTGQPACTFQVVGQIRERTTTGATPYAAILAQARSLGAHAVIDLRERPEYDSSYRLVAARWTASAITFADPADPACYP